MTQPSKAKIVLSLLSKIPLFYDAQGSTAHHTFDIYIGHRLSACLKLAWGDPERQDDAGHDRYLIEMHSEGRGERLRFQATLDSPQHVRALCAGPGALRGEFSETALRLYRPDPHPGQTDWLEFISDDGQALRLYWVDDQGIKQVKLHWPGRPGALTLEAEQLINLLDLLGRNTDRDQQVVSTGHEIIGVTRGTLTWAGQRCRLTISPSRLQRVHHLLCSDPISLTHYLRRYA